MKDRKWIPQVQVSGSENTPQPENTQNTQNTQTTLSQTTPNPDVEMTGTQGAVNEGQTEQAQEDTLPGTQTTEEPAKPTEPEPPTPAKKAPGLRFLDYLTSPIVELVVGEGENQTTLTAHQSLLLESPLLAEHAEAFKDGQRRIELPDQNVEAFGCFLQFQYTRDYSSLQTEASEDAVGEVDDSGEQLLKHARVYILAEKLGMPALKTLAHSKIHRINSTSHGEIAYARYVYTNTPADDITIRKPVASFWAQRSHVMRHEAEEEFKKLCVEVPEFAWDVLSLVLDWKEKRAQDRAEQDSGAKGSARKRLRSGL